MSSRKSLGERRKALTKKLHERLALPELSPMLVTDDAQTFIGNVLNSLDRGIDLAQDMANSEKEETKSGQKPNLDPLTHIAIERVVGLHRCYFQAAREDGNPMEAGFFGAALAFAVVEF